MKRIVNRTLYNTVQYKKLDDHFEATAVLKVSQFGMFTLLLYFVFNFVHFIIPNTNFPMEFLGRKANGSSAVLPT